MPRNAQRPPRQLQLVSIDVAAERLNVNSRSVRRWIADGRIPGYRVGRLLKVDLAEVDAFVRPVPVATAAADSSRQNGHS